ncbi:MAG: autotransporter domain-containing protein [Lactobacillaceae bacterium]|jgi:outer membrane autotransporter protein|nr:autotransporter domain-containing protein [Lactobacillaceae bacterium]
MKNKLLITTAIACLVSVLNAPKASADINIGGSSLPVSSINNQVYNVYNGGRIYRSSGDISITNGGVAHLSNGGTIEASGNVNISGTNGTRDSVLISNQGTNYVGLYGSINTSDGGWVKVSEGSTLIVLSGYDSKKKEILQTINIGNDGSAEIHGTLKGNVKGTGDGTLALIGEKAKIVGSVANIADLAFLGKEEGIAKKGLALSKMFEKGYSVADTGSVRVTRNANLIIDSVLFKNSQDVYGQYASTNVINGGLDVRGGAMLTINKHVQIGNPFEELVGEYDGVLYIDQSSTVIGNKANITAAEEVQLFTGAALNINGGMLTTQTFSTDASNVKLSKAAIFVADNAVIDNGSNLTVLDTSNFGSVKAIMSLESYGNPYSGSTDNYKAVVRDSVLTLDGKSKLENSLYEVQMNKGKVNFVLVGANTGKTYHEAEGGFESVMDTYDRVKGTINIVNSTVNMKGTATIENNMRGNENDTGNVIIDNSTVNVLGKNKILATNAVGFTNTTVNIDKGKSLAGNSKFFMQGGTLNLGGILDAEFYGDTSVNITGAAAKFNKNVIVSNMAVNGVNLTLSKLIAKGASLNIVDDFTLNNSKTTFDADSSVVSFEGLIADKSTLTMKKALNLNSNFNLNDSALTATKGADITAANINISGGISSKKKITLTDVQVLAQDDISITDANLILNKGVNLGAAGVITVSGASIIDVKGDAVIEGPAIYFQDSAKLIIGAGKNVGNDSSTFTMGGNSKLELNGKLYGDVSGSGSDSILDFKNAKASLFGDISNMGNVNFTKVTAKVSDLYSGTMTGIENVNLINSKLTLTSNWDGFDNLNLNTSSIYLGASTLTALSEVNISDKSSIFLNVNSAAEYGRIVADTINLAADSKAINMTVTLTKGIDLADNTEFKFLDYNTITGSLNKVTISNNRFKFTETDVGQFTVEQTSTGKGVIERYSGPVFGALAAKSAADVFVDNQAEFTSVKQAELAENLNVLSQAVGGEQQYVNTLRAVNPDDTGAVSRSAIEASNVVLDAAANRTSSSGITSASESSSFGDTGVNGYATWVQMLVNKTKLGNTTDYEGFKGNTTGLALGAEKQLNKAAKAGVGYAYTQSDVKNSIRKVEADTNSVMLYGEYKPNDWFINAVASYGRSDYDAKTAAAKADFDVDAAALKLMTGYDFRFNAATLTPVAGVRYTHLRQDAYTDSNDVKVSSDNSDILTAIVGAKVKHNHVFGNGMNVRPEARFALTYDIANDGINSAVSLSNGSGYIVEGRALNRFGWEFGAGLTADVSNDVEMSLGYEGKFREDYQDHTGLLNLRYKF